MFLELSTRPPTVPSPFEALEMLRSGEGAIALVSREFHFGPRQIPTEALIACHDWLNHSREPYLFIRHDPIYDTKTKQELLLAQQGRIQSRFGNGDVVMLRTLTIQFTPAPRLEGLTKPQIEEVRRSFDYSPCTILVSSTAEHVRKSDLKLIAEALSFSNNSLVKDTTLQPNNDRFSPQRDLHLAPGIIGPFFRAASAHNLRAAFYIEEPEVARGFPQACEIAITPCDSLVVHTWVVRHLLAAYEQRCGVKLYNILMRPRIEA